jgi:hypothetical protein
MFSHEHRINSQYPQYNLPDLFICYTETYNEQIINKFKRGKYYKQHGKIATMLHKKQTGNLNNSGYKQKKGKCFQIFRYGWLVIQGEGC